MEILNEVAPKRIVTTCPHCLHTIKNEYPAFGGNYEVVHHTQLINELVGAGKISMNLEGDNMKVTFHDPCYLGRHNKVFDAPRDDLKSAGLEVIEMPRNSAKSFCCGAGGAQMWKEEEPGDARVNEARFAEAKATGANAFGAHDLGVLTMLITNLLKQLRYICPLKKPMRGQGSPLPSCGFLLGHQVRCMQQRPDAEVQHQ